MGISQSENRCIGTFLTPPGKKRKKKLPTTDDLRFFVVFFQDLQFAFIFHQADVEFKINKGRNQEQREREWKRITRETREDTLFS